MDETGSMQAGSGGAMGCDWQREWHDVQAVCRHLGHIPVEMIDLSREYWLHVFEPALELWHDGSTPNPDVECNRYVDAHQLRSIKFGALRDRLQSQHPGWLATGHYAQIAWRRDDQGQLYPLIQRAVDRLKDQSFFLSSVPSERLTQVRRLSDHETLFPLGTYVKADVRRLAREMNLPTADKDESMGLCFVGERGSSAHAFARFLDNYVTSEPGDFVTPDGRVVGRHPGLYTLTIGQRARIPSLPQRYFVAKKDVAQRRIVVVPDKTHPLLQCAFLHSRSFVWAHHLPRWDATLQAQIRYRQDAEPCRVTPLADGGVQVAFPQGITAVSPGQTVVVYEGDLCVGSGTIDHVHTMGD
ncbi:tRNA-5-taurinomethyluridine 2-sulfurtransferase [Malassezia equina]|uniref:tRNA-5-taurinomethyluridine 2-sulfurtransferase n=1 Tax=Malassezia equina TaxID=1381935 RepID=A0AAF0J0H7_9BASI|nr:tRNA-5-taurinomethyluridine 2-sulfurtransferase [Malassezia equina]